MKKILILANSDLGLYRFRKELIIKLVEKGHQVVFSCPNGPKVEPLIKFGATYYPVKIQRRSMNPWSDLKLFLTYLKLAKTIKPELILTYTIKPNIYGSLVARIKRVPVIVTITGLGTSLSQGFKSLIPLKLYKVALKKAKVVFFQNQANLDYMIKHKVIKDNYQLVNGSGVNLEDFPFKPYPDQKELHFIFVGRIMKAKGIDEYLDAAKVIKNKYSHTYFHVIGSLEEDYESKLNEFEKNGIIQYHGPVDNVQPFYEMCHAIIHQSHHEGLSNVLLEAGATGRPIIASDIPGCKETFVDGVSGLSLKRTDSNTLLEKLTYFIEISHEKKRNMGLASYEYVRRNFNRDDVIKAYLKEIVI
jgi:galacturonosyltransferase